MDPNYLLNDLWWNEPILVQQENAYAQLYESLENIESLMTPSSY
jgi:hypothetical protein